MGFLDRVKNMFTEEVEEQVENEKIVVEKVEKEEINTEEVTKEEKLVPKKEERMMPIFFDDQDFATLDKPKEERKTVSLEEKYYTKKTETPEKKVFKLSPVISPVYGVLDKNYHKEDITPKRSTPRVTYYDTESISIDEVRKKAYGNLNEDVVTSEPIKEEVQEEVIGSRMQRKYHRDMMFEDLMNPDYEPKKEEKHFEDGVKSMEPVSLDDFLIHDEKEYEDDFKDPNEDTLTESDLFHLIDSMYDKEEE